MAKLDNLVNGMKKIDNLVNGMNIFPTLNSPSNDEQCGSIIPFN